MVKSKKNTRRSTRKTKGRKGAKRSTRRNRLMYGGEYSAEKLSLAQGQQFLSNYPTQRMTQSGGAYGNYSGHGAPVGDQGLLDPALRDMARIQPLDAKLTEISGMRDPDQMGGMPTMSGGRRRRNSRKSKKTKKASKKSRKGSRKGSRKSKKSRKGRKGSRRQRGGAYGNYSGSGQPLSAPNMLLSASEAAKAGTADFSNPLLKD